MAYGNRPTNPAATGRGAPGAQTITPQAQTGGGRFRTRRELGLRTRPSAVDVARAVARSQKGGEEPTDDEVAQAGIQIAQQAGEQDLTDKDFVKQAKEEGREDFKKLLPFMLMSGLGSMRQSQAQRQPAQFGGVAALLNMAQRKQEERLKSAEQKKAELKSEREAEKERQKRLDPNTPEARSARTTAAIYASKAGLSSKQLGLDQMGVAGLKEFTKNAELLVKEAGKTQRAKEKTRQQMMQLAQDAQQFEEEMKVERQKAGARERAAEVEAEAGIKKLREERGYERVQQIREEVYKPARDVEQSLLRMEELVDQGQIGTGQLQGSTIGQVFQEITGLGGDEAMARFRAIQNQLTLAKTGALQGPLTDKDLQMLAEAGPNAKMTEPQLKKAIDKAQEVVKQNKKYFREANDYFEQNNTMRGFDEHWERTRDKFSWEQGQQNKDQQQGQQQDGQGQQRQTVTGPPGENEVDMQTPDGETRRVHADEVQDAVAAGYTFDTERDKQRYEQFQQRQRRGPAGNL